MLLDLLLPAARSIRRHALMFCPCRALCRHVERVTRALRSKMLLPVYFVYAPFTSAPLCACYVAVVCLPHAGRDAVMRARPRYTRY